MTSAKRSRVSLLRLGGLHHKRSSTMRVVGGWKPVRSALAISPAETPFFFCLRPKEQIHVAAPVIGQSIAFSAAP